MEERLYDDQRLCDMLAGEATRRRGFELMVRQYGESIYWTVRRMVLSHEDANDVVQNALLKAWNALDTFKGEAKISTWLTRIAINEALDFMRREKQRKASVSTDDTEAAASVASRLVADEYFDGDETEAQLQEAIAQLPDVQRTVFLMRYYDEMRYSDISTVLGTSEGALKASYHYAVKKITDFFHRHD